MRIDINIVVLQGRLTADPEFSVTTEGKPLARFTIANNNKDQAYFILVKAWEKTAEIARDYLFKGREVIVEGRIRQSSYEKDGERKSFVYVMALMIKLLGDNKRHAATGDPKPAEKDPENVPEVTGENIDPADYDLENMDLSLPADGDVPF